MIILSYTNDVARGRKPCQAGANAKFSDCRIKTHLPRTLVHKAGKPVHQERAACTFVYERYLSKHSLRNFAAQPGPWGA